MRNAYVTMIGGTLLIAAVLGGIGAVIMPRGPVLTVSAKDAATASSGSASEQAAALEAAEAEARENPPPPSVPASVMMEDASSTSQPASSAPSGYQGSVPAPTIQFANPGSERSEDVSAEPATGED